MKLKVSWTIHLFALLHAVATTLCSLAGVGDTLLLTMLTMAMTVIICVKRNLSVEFSAISIVLVNIAGFLLGSIGADLFSLFTSNPLVVHAAATFLSTEILGWSLNLMSKSFTRDDTDASTWKTGLGWLIAAFLIVLMVRIFLDILFSSGFYDDANVTDILSNLLKNTLAIILMVGCTFVAIRYIRRKSGRKSRVNAFLMTVAIITALSAAGAAMEGWGIPFHPHTGLTLRYFAQIFILSMLVEMTIYAVLYTIIYASDIRETMRLERSRTHQAEYRYMALKQQLNPHFLFNSLNILDSLISVGSRDDASQYVHRLAGMYRYMLRHEALKTVKLSEETVFLDMYRDLLLVRFPEGFEIRLEIREEDLSRGIVPCTLQLLAENALKHNAISADNPLVILLKSDGESLTVENNIIPKISKSESTGLGIKYIQQQYKDIADKEVTVLNDGQTFRVTMPLL